MYLDHPTPGVTSVELMAMFAAPSEMYCNAVVSFLSVLFIVQHWIGFGEKKLNQGYVLKQG